MYIIIILTPDVGHMIVHIHGACCVVLYIRSHCTQVIVGEIGPGDCIGEVFLRGVETQPYSIITCTPHTRIGWIDSITIKGNSSTQ